MSILIKPCPFCGGNGMFKFCYTDGVHKIHWVACGHCQAKIHGRRKAKDAIEAWNKRY